MKLFRDVHDRSDGTKYTVFLKFWQDISNVCWDKEATPCLSVQYVPYCRFAAV
jgi:hypothetical protein